MKSLQTKIHLSSNAIETFILMLLLLLPTSVGWSGEQRKTPATALSDQEAVEWVRDKFVDHPTFISSLVAIRQFNGQRTLIIPFKSVIPEELSGEVGQRYRSVEAGVDMAAGFLIGGTAVSMAKEPIYSVIVLVLSENRHLAFQASAANIRALIAGNKTPESFFANDLRVITVANPVR